MLTMIVAASLALLITYLVMTVSRTDSDQLREPHCPSLAVGVQIVCGDCAGIGKEPRRTLLSGSGVCEQCGGRSYILASEWAMMRLLARRRAQEEREPLTPARVLTFDRRTASRAVRREKVAV